MDLKERGYGKTVLWAIAGVIIFLIVLLVMFYLLLYTEKCLDSDCFNKNLVKCRRASWINDAKEATWLYTIKGKSEGSCEVEVKLNIIKEGKSDIAEAEGKTMACHIPLNTMTTPGKDLEQCTGQLKEDLQELIIKRMHSYILENLGEISEELTKTM